MPRRRALTEAQLMNLLALPTAEQGAAADLVAIHLLTSHSNGISAEQA